MKFTLTITLGNAAMLTAEDIAGAIFGIAGRLERICPSGDLTDEDSNNTGAGGPVKDINGNTVGKWELA